MDYVQKIKEDLKSSDPDVRERAVQIMEIIGNDRVKDALFEALDDGSDRIRGIAARALGNICDEAPKELLELTKDDNYFVRGCACEALGKIGDQEAIEELVERLDDEKGWVQDEAANALIKIDQPQGMRELRKWMREGY